MAYTITYGGESTHVLAETLRFVLEQPSEWVIRITHGVIRGEDTVHGTIVDLNIEGGCVTLADLDEDDQATGAETTIDFHHITELEIF